MQWPGGVYNVMPVLDSDGQYVSMVGVSRDISERKQLETQREHLLKVRTEAWREAMAATLAASEDEARRIGRGLHDTLCQDLTALSRQAETLAAGLSASNLALQRGDAIHLIRITREAIMNAVRDAGGHTDRPSGDEEDQYRRRRSPVIRCLTH